MQEYRLTVWYGNHPKRDKNKCDKITIETHVPHTPYLLLNCYLNRHPNGFVEFVLEAKDCNGEWFVYDETGAG